MRAFTFLLSLGLIAPAFALPAPKTNTPVLFAKDPLSIHKRSADTPSIPSTLSSAFDSIDEDELEEETTSTFNVAVDDSIEEACSDVCGTIRVSGAMTERDALCSVQGLRATLECAQCIDITWPDTTYDDSALAEYERIVLACEDAPQVTLVQHQTL